jgi:hypothetical protein
MFGSSRISASAYSGKTEANFLFAALKACERMARALRSAVEALICEECQREKLAEGTGGTDAASSDCLVGRLGDHEREQTSEAAGIHKAKRNRKRKGGQHDVRRARQ